MRKVGLLALAAMAVAFGVSTARADEPLFGYVYATDVLPKGKFEVEQWITDREGQSHGHFHDLQLREEVEYGLTDNLQISGYINSSYVDANRNSVQRLTEGLDIPGDHDPARPYRRFRFDTVSAEVIYRVLSPYKDPIGLAFYIEPEIGPRERAVELRTILQKNFLDDRLVVAANAWLEFEREKDHEIEPSGERALEIEKATQLEFDLGASYRFRPNWSVGLEYRNHNEFTGYGLGDQEHSAHFLGPNIHYANQNWFFTLTALFQVHATGYNDEQRAAIVHSRIYGSEHARWDGIRLKVGRVFR